jgi:hypothetical protein
VATTTPISTSLALLHLTARLTSRIRQVTHLSSTDIDSSWGREKLATSTAISTAPGGLRSAGRSQQYRHRHRHGHRNRHQQRPGVEGRGSHRQQQQSPIVSIDSTWGVEQPADSGLLRKAPRSHESIKGGLMILWGGGKGVSPERVPPVVCSCTRNRRRNKGCFPGRCARGRTFVKTIGMLLR